MAETGTVAAVFARLRQSFLAGRSEDLAWRRDQLRQVRRLLREHAGDIATALTADLGKSPFESYLTETGFVLEEIEVALKGLGSWARGRRVSVPLRLQPGRAEVRQRPYGVVLVLSPWNYPLQLALVPLVSALAAGNCVLLKPSEMSPACSALLARLLPAYLDPAAVAVVTGGAEMAEALLALPPDYIFFTGSGAVGRKVMAAAAAHLTPLTLELGGKCPCIVDAGADIAVAARRIMWGKCLNAGQTCVAPDYVLVDERIDEAFTAACSDALRAFFGPDPAASRDYSRIINAAHHQRLRALLADGVVLHGGRCEPAQRYLEPTLLGEVPLDSAVMREEIFGPILPIVPYASLADAVDIIRARPAPLALYVFSRSAAFCERVFAQVSCGGVCVNDVLMHVTVHDLPFGGVGASGMGVCHGRSGFETFSRPQSVLMRGDWPDPALRYPPYSSFAQSLLGYRRVERKD